MKKYTVSEKKNYKGQTCILVSFERNPPPAIRKILKDLGLKMDEFYGFWWKVKESEAEAQIISKLLETY